MSRKKEEVINYWKDHFNRWSDSGKSQTEYCKENNLTTRAFGYWKRKFSKQQEGGFIEIKRKSDRINHSAFIELITSDGMVMRFREDISLTCLRNIISILRS